MYLENTQRRLQLSSGAEPVDPDELAYVLATTVLNYLPAAPSSGDYYEVLGVLGAVRAEFERRGLGTWQDQRVALNGDIDWTDLPQNKGKVD